MKVAHLYFRHITQVEIADKLNVSRQTVSRDIKALESMWRKRLIDDPVAVRSRELAELRDMERECAVQYAASTKKERGWVTTRLSVKERIAKLLGLDAPTKQEHTGKDGEMLAPIIVTLELGAERGVGDDSEQG